MALTDEELAELHLRVQEEIWNIGNEDDCAEADSALASLVAALRASRTQIAVLEARLASAERMRAASFDRAERLEREARA